MRDVDREVIGRSRSPRRPWAARLMAWLGRGAFTLLIHAAAAPDVRNGRGAGAGESDKASAGAADELRDPGLSPSDG